MQKRLKALLSKDGWTQRKLSNEIGVSVSTIKAWLSKNERDVRIPNKWVSVVLEEIFDREGV